MNNGFFNNFPIMEFDNCKEAIIEPEFLIKNKISLKIGIGCFFSEIIKDLLDENALQQIAEQKSEIGNHPIYKYGYKKRDFILFHPGEGAPLAGALVEEVFAMGCDHIIFCGGAGVLKASMYLGQIILPTSAIRDEGTSYHYLPPSREVFPSTTIIKTIRSVLNKNSIDFIEGKVWTTDAVYRETKNKVINRKSEGCICVDMEASALYAIADFRSKKVGHILYAGDSLINNKWKHRNWNRKTNIRQKVFEYACESCFELSKTIEIQQ